MQQNAERNTGERGAAAIELALVLFPLVMLLLGTVEFGRYYSVKLAFERAAGAAAREIALHHDELTPAQLDAKVDGHLALVPPEYRDPFGTKTIVKCSPTEPDAIVVVGDSVDLAIPLPDVGGSGRTSPSVGVAARARMPCEG